jgi:hypothetical protein
VTYPEPGQNDPYGQQPLPPQYPEPGQFSQPNQLQPYQPQQPSYPMPVYQQPPQYGYPYNRPVPQEQGMAVASLVLSLIGIFLCFTAILGIIFGHIGYAKAKRGEAGGQGMAQAGMIIGYVITGLWLIPLTLWLIAIFAVVGGASTQL